MKKYIMFFVFIICILGYSNTKVKAEETPTINKEKMTVYIGNKGYLKLDDTTEKIKWSSDNRTIATVDQKGVVYGKSKGSCTITATLDGEKYKCSVNVKPPYVSPTKSLLKVGQKEKFVVKGAVKGAKITWESSNKKIATVDSKGNVTGVSSGKVTIIATIKDKTYKRTVNVSESEKPDINCFIVVKDIYTDILALVVENKGDKPVTIINDAFIYDSVSDSFDNKLSLINLTDEDISFTSEIILSEDGDNALFVDENLEDMWILDFRYIVFDFEYDGIVYVGMANTSMSGFSYMVKDK